MSAEAIASVVIPFEYDFLKPDYAMVFKHRAQFLARIRASNAFPRLKVFYKNNPIQFIADWGVTFEPRNPEIGLPSKIPFVPFQRQIEWMEWVLERWGKRQRGMTIKSRGSGCSWSAVMLASTLCLFNRGIVIGFGSRKAEYVDALGDPKSLFFKARMFLNNLPEEFRCGWEEKDHSRQMRIAFPATESALTGESGDGIGRGDRTSMTFVDEAGFLEHAELTEASLSDTTNCRIDISTSPGPGTVFADRLAFLEERGAHEQIFKFDYRQDPRRDAKWLESMRLKIAPEVFKREFEMSLDVSGEFFTLDMLLVNGQPVETPPALDVVYAVIDTANKSGKEHDGLAVVYMGLLPRDVPGPRLVILDWHLTQIDAAFLIEWLPSVYAELEDLAKECKALQGSLGTWIEDKTSGTVLIQQAQNLDFNVHAIDSKLTSLGKAERCINISGYIHRGECKFTRRAYEKTVTYKATTKNHLLTQILTFRAGIKDLKQDDALDAWSYAVAIGTGNGEGF